MDTLTNYDDIDLSDLRGSESDAQTVAEPGSFRVFRGLLSEDENAAASIGRDTDSTKRLDAIMDRLRVLGPYRSIRQPVETWQGDLDRLELEFCNFQTVIENVIRPHLNLLTQGKPHRMQVMLLLGDPGIGKTEFVRQLESIFNVPALFINLAGETNGSSVCGSSTFWGNSQPGKLFERMAWGADGDARQAVANPLVVLDEVDKVSGTYSPIGGLYTLLEEQTATRFEDQSVPGVLIDTSRVRFILTANDATSIPSALMSRVTPLHIEPPTLQQLKGIAQRIYGGLLSKYELNLEPELPDAVLDDLVHLSPRKAKIRLEAAVALAAVSGSPGLSLSTWRKTQGAVKTKKAPMGFL